MPLETDICVCATALLGNGIAEFHGYDLAKQLASMSDRQSLAAHGTLYRALARLVDMGLLTSRWEDPTVAANDNRPRRRFYALTRSGRTVALQAVEARAAAVLPRRMRKGWAPA